LIFVIFEFGEGLRPTPTEPRLEGPDGLKGSVAESFLASVDESSLEKFGSSFRESLLSCEACKLILSILVVPRVGRPDVLKGSVTES